MDKEMALMEQIGPNPDVIEMIKTILTQNEKILLMNQYLLQVLSQQPVRVTPEPKRTHDAGK